MFLWSILNYMSCGVHCFAFTLISTHMSFQALRGSDSDLVRKDILEELSRQLEVLEKIGQLSLGKTDDFSVQDSKWFSV